MYKFQIHFVNSAANWCTKTECVLKHFNIEKFTNRKMKWRSRHAYFSPIIAIRYSKKLGGKISEVATVIRKSSVEDFTARLRKFLLLLDKSRASGTRFEDSRLFQFFTGAPPARNKPSNLAVRQPNEWPNERSFSEFTYRDLSEPDPVRKWRRFSPPPDPTTPIHSKMSLTRTIAVVR